MSISVSRLLRWPSALWEQRELLWKLSRREVEGRYRGSVLGWGWSLITPLLMLGVYTFVFSQVFKARWGDLESSGPWLFAINLFAGLIVFNVFSETTNASPALILSKSNLVTKVIFPLEILPAVTLIAALFHGLTSLMVLIVFELISQGQIPLTIAWIPVIWIPLAGGCLTLGWTLSALGIYLRDLTQVVGVITNLLMFLSAVFYPLSALPERWQPLLRLNPLVIIIEQTRRVAVNGLQPSFSYVLAASLLSIITCEIAYRGFQKARRGFADVL
ncbi:MULTISPECIES: ABC transporter permease [Prochlorococcus]|uniref:ABC transporter permease n=1 Tax=Prochlorococcus TaxID=1218 RepID=UPI0007B3B7FD|nr:MULTISPECIES: ABC transporter permease [Prochlorococcus]KZR66187.1 Teichoic acid translocation permease protein TagG [Prochlorococcus marinus str. MIT 1312]KZR83019.1 Teichoic acid translocation permease protein TagG [Prochlorococcus marinus str. MIT 1327]NMO83970.1 ABC transporter permease [Prochlorococcus sp. P1344]NMP05490.1 ABC transporter permease [Prochlorococcus sp. P1361]NMP13068.1 ABC transporter permease [Prochlorococcus sp.P1363]